MRGCVGADAKKMSEPCFKDPSLRTDNTDDEGSTIFSRQYSVAKDTDDEGSVDLDRFMLGVKTATLELAIGILCYSSADSYSGLRRLNG